MQLAMTILGHISCYLPREVLGAISNCDCHILHLKCSNLSGTTVSYILVKGRWNQIVKLEMAIENVKSDLDVLIHTLRLEVEQKKQDSLLYSLEITTSSHGCIIEDLSDFLFHQSIVIEDIDAQSLPPAFTQKSLFFIKFILLVPTKLSISKLRRELAEFSNVLNIDIIFKPITQII
jgi:glycine cleavage system regulatory protein